MKMALERYVEKLEISTIGKLSRLDEAVIGCGACEPQK